MSHDSIPFKDVGLNKRFVCACEVWIKTSVNEAQNVNSTKRSTFEPHFMVSRRTSVTPALRKLTQPAATSSRQGRNNVCAGSPG